MRRHRTVLTALVAAAGVALLPVAAAAPATAAAAPSTLPQSAFADGVLVAAGPERTSAVVASPAAGQERTFTTYRVIDITKTENAVGSATIAHCVAATAGGQCSVSAGVLVSATVGVTLGATVQMVSAQLQANVTTQVSLTVGCTSPVMAAGQSWDAHPVGTLYSYRIERRNLFTGTTRSGVLTAFVPDANGIACGLS